MSRHTTHLECDAWRIWSPKEQRLGPRTFCSLPAPDHLTTRLLCRVTCDECLDLLAEYHGWGPRWRQLVERHGPPR